MIQIFNPPAWHSAQHLATTMVQLETTAAVITRAPMHTCPTVNWGFSNSLGTYILNEHIVGNKLRELQKLTDAGIPTIPFAKDRPAEHWLPRILHHKSGVDLRRYDALQQGRRRNLGFKPDFWVERLDVAHEFRLHVFNRKSIRAGIKVPNEEADRPPHPWIRSLKTGWKIDYGTVCQEMLNRIKGIRQLAKDVIEVIDYDFGAVDIGTLTDGTRVVFEVNSAPGLDNDNTAFVYAKHIIETIRE